MARVSRELRRSTGLRRYSKLRGSRREKNDRGEITGMQVQKDLRTGWGWVVKRRLEKLNGVQKGKKVQRAEESQD